MSIYLDKIKNLAEHLDVNWIDENAILFIGYPKASGEYNDFHITNLHLIPNLVMPIKMQCYDRLK